MRFELHYDNGMFGGVFGSLIIARREARDERGWQQIVTPRRDRAIGIEEPKFRNLNARSLKRNK